MGMVKRKMMEVQDEARKAFEDGVEENPYIDTMFEQTWTQARDARADEYGEYLDRLAEELDYYQ